MDLCRSHHSESPFTGQARFLYFRREGSGVFTLGPDTPHRSPDPLARGTPASPTAARTPRIGDCPHRRACPLVRVASHDARRDVVLERAAPRACGDGYAAVPGRCATRPPLCASTPG